MRAVGGGGAAVPHCLVTSLGNTDLVSLINTRGQLQTTLSIYWVENGDDIIFSKWDLSHLVIS